MNECRYACMHAWTNERTNERMNEWMCACMYACMNEWLNAWMREWMNEWTNERTNEWMNEVVLIRCLDEWMDFWCPPAVIFIRGRVGDLSFFLWLFFGSHFGWILGPAGTPKSTKNRFFGKKGVPGSSFLTIFAAHAFFLDFFVDFPSILA